MSDLKYVGKSIPFKYADQKIAGDLKYVSDLSMPGMLHLKLLTAGIPRGKVKEIDTTRAEALDGVKKVYTFKNTPRRPFNGYYWYRDQEMIKDEVLLTDYVRHVGDRVAAVAAESSETAERACELIEVEYEKQEKPILDLEEALVGGDALHEKGNPFAEREFAYGDVDGLFAKTPSELIFSDKMETPKVHHAAMENHACLAYPEPQGKLTVISPCQLIFSVRLIISTLLDLPLNRVRVIKGNMGGSFGAKQETFLEPLAAFVARDLNRPVKIFFNRRESILATRTRSKILGKVKTAVSPEGKILGRDIDVIVDAGGYTSNGDIVSAAMAKKISRLYRIEHQRYHSYSVHTTTPPGGPCRGYGSPQIHALTEVNLDRAAAALGIDRVELRLKNLLHPHEKDLLGGPDIGNARIIEALEKGREEFNWTRKKKANQKSGRSGRYRRGIGVACATHVNGYYNVYPDFSGINIRFYEDGSILLNTSIHDLGTGARTIMAQIAGEVLEVDPEQITVLEGDTDRSPYDVGCHASRGTYVIGKAVQQAAVKLRELLLEETKKLAKNLPGVKPEEKLEVVIEEGRIRIGSDHYSYQEIISRIQLENQQELNVNYSYHSQANPASYGAHFVQAEVDTFTGLVEVKDYVAVHDVGQAINPLAVKTQIDGGVQMGIGMALMEEIDFDQKGYPLNTNFHDYHLINAPAMPEIRVFLIEDKEPHGPYGAKSIGEISTVPVAAAVVNAVNDALGKFLTTLPLTPPRIIDALY